MQTMAIDVIGMIKQTVRTSMTETCNVYSWISFTDPTKNEEADYKTYWHFGTPIRELVLNEKVLSSLIFLLLREISFISLQIREDEVQRYVKYFSNYVGN